MTRFQTQELRGHKHDRIARQNKERQAGNKSLYS